jgi:Fe-S-cluster-containing hydrogenase component 2
MPEGLKTTGYLSDEEIKSGPGIPSAERRTKGPVAVIECIQPIPCNPCETSCKVNAIAVGHDITNLPILDQDKCIGCASCIAICPGQAIFVVDDGFEEKRSRVMIPYEFLPLPQKGDVVTALDRAGKEVGDAEILNIRKKESMDKTAVVTLAVPKALSMSIRFFKSKN